MAAQADENDARMRDLLTWTRSERNAVPASFEPFSGDASRRRYFRATMASGDTVIAVDAPPAYEDCGRFTRVAALMADAGLNVPRILAADLKRGFLLLSDLGRQTYLDVLDETNADELFSAAISALVRWQRATVAGQLPGYDADLLQRELALFPEWYLERHLGVTISDEQARVWCACRQTLTASAKAQPQVFVHRDYMPRNLMVSTPTPGVIDFQDAVIGPVTYDVASLFHDAFVSWPEERVAAWRREYWRKARDAGVPIQTDYAEFERSCDWMGLQRHLKVLGLFARLEYRDGKKGYLAEAPRFIDYILTVTGRYGELTDLHGLIRDLGVVPGP